MGVTKASADVVKAWRESGKPVPLLVMLNAMMEELDDQENKNAGRAARRAFPFATAAAPFFHAKPQAASGWTPDDPSNTAAEIMAVVRLMKGTVGGAKKK